MEFWGVEVEHGLSLHVDPGEDKIVHISQAALGENNGNGNEPIRLYMTVGNEPILIGMLSHGNVPHMSMEVALESGFELSHSGANGSVFFTGYKETKEAVVKSGSDEDVEPEVEVDNAEDVVAEDEPKSPRLVDFGRNQNHVDMTFHCGCTVTKTFTVTVFRYKGFFYHTQPPTGVPPNLSVEWMERNVTLQCTCSDCGSGARFVGTGLVGANPTGQFHVVSPA